VLFAAYKSHKPGKFAMWLPRRLTQDETFLGLKDYHFFPLRQILKDQACCPPDVIFPSHPFPAAWKFQVIPDHLTPGGRPMRLRMLFGASPEHARLRTISRAYIQEEIRCGKLDDEAFQIGDIPSTLRLCPIRQIDAGASASGHEPGCQMMRFPETRRVFSSATASWSSALTGWTIPGLPAAF